MADKVIRVIAGTNFVIPSDWSGTYTIETIGAGSNPTSVLRGGSGGAYGKITNTLGSVYTVGQNITYAIGAAGVTGGNTWFDGASFALAKVGGQGGQVTAGGLASARPNSANTTGFNGGTQSNIACCGIGAGGAGAGKNGAGGNAPSFSTGGQGDNGTGGTGAAPGPIAATDGAEWSFTDTWNGTAFTGVSGTIGAGGGGGNVNGSNMNAGLYASGGGVNGANVGVSSQGFMIITYTPGAAGTQTFVPGPKWDSGSFQTEIVSYG